MVLLIYKLNNSFHFILLFLIYYILLFSFNIYLEKNKINYVRFKKKKMEKKVALSRRRSLTK